MSILDRLAAGNFHLGTGINAGHVGTVDPKAMVLIVEECRDLIANSPSSVVTETHGTGWTKPVGTVEQWSLYNNHGYTNNFKNDFSYRLEDKRFIAGIPAIQMLMETFPVQDLVNLRLNYMHPNSALSPHEEHLTLAIGEDKVGLRARFHLPVITNPKVTMMSGGNVYHFKAGELYVFNNGAVHSAENMGDQARAHLVWDMLMTERVEQAMFSQLEELKPLEHFTYASWERQDGMSFQEFAARELVYMP